MTHFTDFENNSISMPGNDNYISRAKLHIFLLIFAIMLIPLFCLLGSIGNILSLVVLIHQRMRNQTNYVLAALCISDTLFLIHSLIYTSLNIYKKVNPVEGEAVRAYVYPVVGAYGSVVTARITSSLTVLLCVERFVAVFFPMQAKTICSKRNTCIAIFAIYVSTMIVFIPFSLKYEATEVEFGNTTRTFMNQTVFFKNNKKFYDVYGTILNILFRFAPLVILPILNILIIRAVDKTWKLRRQMSESDSTCSLRLSSRNGKHFRSNDQYHITIMLLTVSFIFLICILPGALNSIATHIWPVYSPLGGARNLYICISTVTFLLETINSSVNFIVYMALSRKFRLLYKVIFCCGNGEYYAKVSISSVKEKFRWSSNRKNSQDNSLRKIRSDLGPLRNCNQSDMYNREWKCGAHSDGFDFSNGAVKEDVVFNLLGDSSDHVNGDCQKPGNIQQDKLTGSGSELELNEEIKANTTSCVDHCNGKVYTTTSDIIRSKIRNPVVKHFEKFKMNAISSFATEKTICE